MHTTTRPHVYRSLPSTSPSRSPLIKVFFLSMNFGPQLGDLWILWTFKIALYALRDIATNYFPSVAEIIERASRKHKTPYVQSDICMQSIHNNYSLFIVYNTPCSTSTSTSPFFFYCSLFLSLSLAIAIFFSLSLHFFNTLFIYLSVCVCDANVIVKCKILNMQTTWNTQRYIWKVLLGIQTLLCEGSTCT